MFVSVLFVCGCASAPQADFCQSPSSDTYNIYFAFNSPAVDQKGIDTAKHIAQFASCCGKTINLGGYTDIKGGKAYNLKLGQHRADAVKALLVSLGLPEKSITAVSYGYADPVAQGDTDEGNSQNRRVTARLN